jgi:tetratricopeptide (TPR) repeat protein
LRLFAELEKNDDVQIAFLEEIVAQEPTDTRSRFSLAFKHSESSNEDMALHHYLRIPGPYRDSATWNNLGVSFESFGMPVKSVAAYRRAAEQNETLAMSNLAFKLLHVGFIDEAREECERALQIPERHKNIGQLLGRLGDVPIEEDRKLEEAQEKLKNKAAFYRKLGEAAAAAAFPLPSGNWSTPDGILTAAVKGNMVSMSGKFQRPANPLAGLLGVTQSTYTLTVDFRVEFRGQMGFGTVKREREGATPSLLSEGSNESKVLLYFDGPGTLKIMEQPNTAYPTFYAMDRLEVPRIPKSPGGDS